MNKAKGQTAAAADLRNRAEELLAEKKNGGEPSFVDGDSRRLIHELQVHQVELELQNEELRQSRQALEASLEHYTDLYDFAQMGYFTLDGSGVIREINLAGIALLGKYRSQVLGKRLAAFLSQDSRVAFNELLKRINEGRVKQSCTVTLVIQEPAQALRHMHIEGAPVVWPEASSGRAIEGAVRLAVLDITERKQAEEALRQSEEVFRLAFHTSPDAVCITRANDGYFLDVNEGFATISGYTREELLGKTSLDIDIWADSGDRQRLLEGIKADGRVTNLEITFLLKDGRKVPALMSAAIFTLKGEPHIFSTTKVIEKQKRAEEALRQSEERYRLLVESANEGIVVEQDGMLKSVNASLLGMTGYSAEEFTSQPFMDYVHPEDREAILGHLQRSLTGENVPDGCAFRILDKQGQVKWLHSNSVGIVWEGRPATLNFLTD
ncbi:MAG: PAS domain S-box protein, partial [Syntrophales bacterium LBB04]|nr:PAS domain S-box protein [Syntrophales bacterium LBB04]